MAPAAPSLRVRWWRWCCCLLLVAPTLSPFAAGGRLCRGELRESGERSPPPAKVAELLVAQGVTQVKLYDADPNVLRALSGTGIGIVVTLPNELLAAAAARPAFAEAWVRRNVASWLPSTQIRAIAVGNEVFASPQAGNITTSLVRAVKVSSPVALTALQSSFPPSAGAFRPDLASSVVAPMLDLLRRTGSYLMVNAYPFFAYAANAGVISLDYALFRPNAGVLDPATGLLYDNLLDAQLDAVYAAMKNLGYDDLRLVVSETGWPAENAAAYNGNLARRVLAGDGGTPARPLAELDVYLFALFNEDRKPGPTSERNYGLFYPNEERVYDVAFRLEGTTTTTTRRNQVSPVAGGGGDGGGDLAASATGAATWCLQAALDYACGEGGADCQPIQQDEVCFQPNTLEAHASFAFNSYYQKKARAVGSCDFGGAAVVVHQAPEFGKCQFPAGD
ncbi:unnamed protein product [Spirodela intermedia]|uniref:X8 domain-containing protein n=1 Tax=Spirodela intermedia TaxID=51605 RepID=A0A7I8JK76_SPIIN|nr:unnamed protein product [Spirodela intermedia]CAA6670529.1 unnamed protein product [Spirodela intermedia]